ncbi:RagB/SusD family nutrient uptake outer membrane protein [Muricauda sp. SCSIO 64092]|uniref:RagB/SusD family nutrient uptake outer membrane protein n=1 Tax=Allomuricauda sp. SCSIO 64092 TaxID=2908842 RepID=UPI001FF43E93|nr:RagB/SusD family nutrient uptake outer membrane protein [Muricauda sp. SCSIO 64092]UOY08303.1 RagB/SusD family nutrient uptake outer membrane protein [Muricauda sp. SCSIO 64092]
MKIYNYLWIAIVWICASCSDVLDTEPDSVITENNFFTNESDFEIFSNKFYDYFPRDGRGFVNFIWNADNDSDNLHQMGDGNLLAFGANTINDNPPAYGGGGWSFSRIRSVNFMLGKIDEAPISDAAKNTWSAVGRFFRAYLYFDKVRKYGDVPWYDTALDETSEEIYRPRDPRATVIANIMADLDFAAANLPQDIGNKTTLDRYAALALKARVALYEGTYRKYHSLPEPWEELLNEAVEASLTIMDEGGYALHNDGDVNENYYNYFALRSPGESSETILARHYDISQAVGGHWSQRFIILQAMTGISKSLADDFLCTDGLPVALSPLFDPTTDYDLIEDEMANRDPRMHQTIFNIDVPILSDPIAYFNDEQIPRFDQFFNTGYVIRKFSKLDRALQVPGAADDGAPVFRLGEIYLIFAEAKAELGTLEQADLDASINLLRNRVGMPPMQIATLERDPDSNFDGSLSEIPQVSVLIDEIRRERRVELACEGFRRDDLMRWKAGQLLTLTPLGAKFNGTRYPNAVDQNFARVNEDGFIEPYQGSVRPRLFDENKNYLFPIPPSEIGLYPNGELTQNPGWQ